MSRPGRWSGARLLRPPQSPTILPTTYEDQTLEQCEESSNETVVVLVRLPRAGRHTRSVMVPGTARAHPLPTGMGGNLLRDAMFYADHQVSGEPGHD